MVTLALPRVLPPLAARRNRRQTLHYSNLRLLRPLLFSTDSDTLIYVAFIEQFASWEMTWKSALPRVPLGQKRQTSEIRHLFHLADTVEGLERLRAYITKTNIRHFRGLRHMNGLKLVGSSCVYALRKVQRCTFKVGC